MITDRFSNYPNTIKELEVKYGLDNPDEEGDWSVSHVKCDCGHNLEFETNGELFAAVAKNSVICPNCWLEWKFAYVNSPTLIFEKQ